MAHVLIVGITNTGKTTICFTLAAHYIRKGKKIIVLDPDLRSEWGVPQYRKGITADESKHGLMTDDPKIFLWLCKNSEGCALFIDESGSMIGRFDTQLEWLATQSRKFGHKSHFIMQRAKQVSPTIRGQCSSCICFLQSPDDAKQLSNDFAHECFLEAPSLHKGHYIAKIEDGSSSGWSISKGKAW